MASTIILLRRIRTAQNVSKTTRAMQMIAASKLKKAQDAALASRPYVEKLSSVSRHLTKRVDKPSLPAYMIETNKTGRKLVIAISPDKGLCGGLITNLAREVLTATSKNDKIITVGKKIEGPVSRLSDQLIAAFPFGNTLPAFSVVYPVIEMINEQFLTGKVDKVEIISTHFENIFTQKPQKTQLLPILPEDMSALNTADKGQSVDKAADAFQLFEPDLESILPEILNRYIEMVLYQEILESYLSEQSARMLAMQNATNNARDIIEDLKLEYNKTRQAKITSEILDITSAASSSAKSNSIGKQLENLVKSSYKNGQLDDETVAFISNKLTRNDLKLYIKLLVQEENQKKVFVTASTELDKASKEKIQRLFPDKNVVYSVDLSMITGIKVVENDVEFEINLNKRFHDIIQFLSKND